MTAKKNRGKKKEATGAAIISLAEPEFLAANQAFRQITKEGRCSCGGCLWVIVDKGGKIKKCGDCGYIF